MVNLEDPKRCVTEPCPIIYRIVFRRRGSDLIFSADATNQQVVVSRKNHRTKQYKHYVHPQSEIEACKAEVKAWLTEGKYKLVEAGQAATVEAPTTTDDTVTDA